MFSLIFVITFQFCAYIRAFLKNQKQSFMSGDQNVAVFDPHGNIKKKIGIFKPCQLDCRKFLCHKGISKKNTKEFMTKYWIGHNFLWRKVIWLPFSQVICNCNALSLDIWLGHIYGHNPAGHYGHIANYGHNGHNGSSYYGHKYGQVVCLMKEHYNCSWPVKTVIKLLYTIKSYGRSNIWS